MFLSYAHINCLMILIDFVHFMEVSAQIPVGKAVATFAEQVR